MEWGFTYESDVGRKQWIVKVPDGACPPSIGETLLLTKGLVGTFKVKQRFFQMEMPEEMLTGKPVFGWSFVIEIA